MNEIFPISDWNNKKQVTIASMDKTKNGYNIKIEEESNKIYFSEKNDMMNKIYKDYKDNCKVVLKFKSNMSLPFLRQVMGNKKSLGGK